jgi:hypothetical protein
MMFAKVTIIEFFTIKREKIIPKSAHLAKALGVRYNHAARSGCGAVRLARAVRVGEVVGSNPSIPTKKRHSVNGVF